MFSVGLTGGIGSGKTLISKVFQNFGVPIFYTDIEAKKLYQDPSFLQQIAQTFGEDIIENNQLQNQKLANIVFNNPQALKQLNTLTHPKVLELYKQWQTKQTTPYTILESAIIFESNWQQHFDCIINISTSIEVAIRRVQERDNLNKERIQERINNQYPSHKREELSQYNIKHDDKTMLLPQIIAIHKDILTQINKTK
ncbi:MAG: dephospho-CoA kinase [Bacteroidales bacterium]|nr:dephospho-CoA kinase [Bacteroidales bacterium]